MWTHYSSLLCTPGIVILQCLTTLPEFHIHYASHHIVRIKLNNIGSVSFWAWEEVDPQMKWHYSPFCIQESLLLHLNHVFIQTTPSSIITPYYITYDFYTIFLLHGLFVFAEERKPSENFTEVQTNNFPKWDRINAIFLTYAPHRFFKYLQI